MAIGCNLNITFLFVFLLGICVCVCVVLGIDNLLFPRTNDFLPSIIFCESVYMLITVAAF